MPSTKIGLQLPTGEKNVPEKIKEHEESNKNTPVLGSGPHIVESSIPAPLPNPMLSPLHVGVETGNEQGASAFDCADVARLDKGPTLSLKPTPSNLLKRRASASPEKFDIEKFELLDLRTDLAQHTDDVHPVKRLRIENKLEIAYDISGTPRIASVTPTTILPSGLRIPTPTLVNRLRTKVQLESKRIGPFSVLNALYRHNDLVLLVVTFLTIPSLISLYAISKPFHWLFNRHYTTFVLAIVRTWAPGSEVIFPWRCYKSLCIKDPVLRQKSQWAGREKELRMKEKYEDLRDVPSVRWLQMVVWRHGLAKDMLIQLAVQGLRCPMGILDAVKKMWFIMDLPLNAHRIALCRTNKYITDHVIQRATMFFLKVDMFFTDPAGQVFPPAQQHTNISAYPRRWERRGFIGCDMREILMAERQLTSLWRVIRGWSPDVLGGNSPMNRLDVLKLWVRHKYTPPADLSDEEKRLPIMGIPWWEVGTAGLERTGVSFYSLDGKQTVAVNPGVAGPTIEQHRNQQMLYPHRKRIIVPSEKPREPLLRPDELMIREGIRRKMKMHENWVRMMLWGFCDDAGRALPLRSEEELINWSNGKRPKHPLLSDEEFEKRKAEMVKKANGGTSKAYHQPDGRTAN